MLPVVEASCSRDCARFQGGFMGGGGMAARNALPNTSNQTSQEVIDYEAQVIQNTDWQIVADGKNGGGSPDITYRTVQQVERAGAAVIMIDDSMGAESEYGGTGVTISWPVRDVLPTTATGHVL
jgi:2-methylisocitrate lyase-like PEP mutase family enzyme